MSVLTSNLNNELTTKRFNTSSHTYFKILNCEIKIMMQSGVVVTLDICEWNSIPCESLESREPLLYLIAAFRNKFFLFVTYGRVFCFYFLEKTLSLQ